jgi:hypothetical protein
MPDDTPFQAAATILDYRIVRPVSQTWVILYLTNQVIMLVLRGEARSMVPASLGNRRVSVFG